MLEAAAIGDGDAVLDVGCGTGAPACRILTSHAATVVGITTSAVGVAVATERAAANGVGDRAQFLVRDGMSNGLPDASFDRVWVLESSHLMRDRSALVAECARVLRPGGRMVLCDITLQRPMPFPEVRRLRHELALLRRVFGDARMEPLDVYTDLATSSGLTTERVDDLTAATRPTFERWRENARAHRGELVALLGEEDLAEFVASCDTLEAFWDDGTLGYGLLAATRP
jgi:27-O-demethylrifamycin SV methyltransferase